MPRFDIVIPHYGVGRLTGLCRRCLETIREYSHDYRLIFIDNASQELDLLLPEIERHPGSVLLRNTENLGFVKAVNLGLSISTAPRIVLMNNDNEAMPGWLEKLDMALVGKVGLSGPRTTTLHSWQGQPRFQGTGVMILPPTAMLAFFCTMLRREVFETVGYLDPDFGVGFGDDDWYCHLAKQAGWKLALVRDLVIPHYHRSTFRALYDDQQIQAMQKEALALFKQKCRQA